MRIRTTTSLLLLLLAGPALAADHLDAPRVMSDPRLDINDLYAFQSPVNPDNGVLIMTVNPGAGVIGETVFSSRGRYEFNIDTNGDARADIVYSLFFSRERADGSQLSVLQRNGVNISNSMVGTGRRFRGGGIYRTALHEDPFFFDLNGFNDGFNFTGEDFFAGLNVTAIILEVPIEDLGGPQVGVWASTSEGGRQFDRMGRPAINTVLLPQNRKNTFNNSLPQNDVARFRAPVVATIEALPGGADAEGLADVLLPDILLFHAGRIQ